METIKFCNPQAKKYYFQIKKAMCAICALEFLLSDDFGPIQHKNITIILRHEQSKLVIHTFSDLRHFVSSPHDELS